MSGNEWFAAIAALAAAAHGGALLWLLQRRRRAVPMLALNITVAGAVLAYWLQRMRYFLSGPLDGQVLGLIGFECLVLGAALWGWRGALPALVFSWAGFGVHFCASLAALLFVATFRFDRLM